MVAKRGTKAVKSMIDDLPSGLWITNNCDAMSRLPFIKLNTSGGTTRDAQTYAYDLASQRTNVTRTDSSFVRYGYDEIGQLILARATNSDGSAISTEQRGYFYDSHRQPQDKTNGTSL